MGIVMLEEIDFVRQKNEEGTWLGYRGCGQGGEGEFKVLEKRARMIEEGAVT
ncbi:hypothetical protein HNY73_004823 [Argiope bruennichi]|uniref:Uncharacterized protein n=1 Tax=Argiope bruennichi TaxID=94029 RepID=A0A8T0FUU6_ARGBR|nr:hypothetical protein HNY73_004823 [Argiope bruennichi]